MTPAVWSVTALVGAAVLCWPVRAAPRWRAGGWPGLGSARVAGRRPSRRPAAASDLTTELLLSLVAMVAAQVRAGAEPLAAWRAAVDLQPGAGPTGAGAEPLGWWDAVARAPAAGPHRWSRRQRRPEPAVREAAAALAAGWRLAYRTGAPLADVLDAVAAGLRQEASVAADAEAALAGPRATARLLGVLPLAGIGLGELMGAHPLGVLLRTPAGRGCLLAGLGLLLLGWLWMRRLVAAAVAVA